MHYKLVEFGGIFFNQHDFLCRTILLPQTNLNFVGNQTNSTPHGDVDSTTIERCRWGKIAYTQTTLARWGCCSLNKNNVVSKVRLLFEWWWQCEATSKDVTISMAQLEAMRWVLEMFVISMVRPSWSWESSCLSSGSVELAIGHPWAHF